MLFKKAVVLAGLLFLTFIRIGDVRAQDGKVSLSSVNMTVGELIGEIEKQTRYLFVYNPSLLDTDQVITVEKKEAEITELLETITGKRLRYTVRNRYIIISEKPQPVLEAKPPRDIVIPQEDDPVVFMTGRNFPTEIKAEKRVRPRPKYDILPDPEPDIDEPVIVPDINIVLSRLVLKTNLLYAGAALAPNMAVEIGLSPKSTLEISGGFNVWDHNIKDGNNKKLHHWIVRPEYRYWLSHRFSGHFFGVHAFFANYNISEYDIPLLFEKEYRYEGSAYGGGISYGYYLKLGKSKWSLEFNAGVGLAYLKYDRYKCNRCVTDFVSEDALCILPTRVGVSLGFTIF